MNITLRKVLDVALEAVAIGLELAAKLLHLIELGVGKVAALLRGLKA